MCVGVKGVWIAQAGADGRCQYRCLMHEAAMAALSHHLPPLKSVHPLHLTTPTTALQGCGGGFRALVVRN